ncbi:MAG: NAD(P)/FAD-dependent oxidoreductase, partial [Thermoplasmata archaeon]
MPDASGAVLILGAGVSGCALAFHLTKRSVGPVVVYDPATPAAGATGRAAGVVTEQLWDRWDVEVTRESHREYARLCQRWEPGAYLLNGFVRWTANRDALPALDQARARLRGWGVEIEDADAGDLARWLPEGRFEDVAGALFSPHDACVTPSSLATIYAEGARQAGATFDFGRPFGGVHREGDRWEIDAAHGTLSAPHLVVAAGAWSKRILLAAGHPLPLVPYRTQAAVLLPPVPRTETFP